MTTLLLLLILGLFTVAFRKQIFLQAFKILNPFFYNRRAIGEKLGVLYKQSDSWSTSRKEAGLNLIKVPYAKKFTGFELRLGDIEFIKSFRKRQRQSIADFKIELKKGRRNFLELEEELVSIWHHQLKDCYELPIRDDEFLIADTIKKRRRVGTQSLSLMALDMVKRMLFDNKDLLSEKAALKELNDEERTLYSIPFFTTLDTFMITLAYKTYGDELKDFFDKVPIQYVPMYENGTPVICELKNNGQNNPGNSVFGPIGCVCPGSNVTTQILKAIREFCHTTEWDIEGTPRQAKRMISGIANPEELYITIH